MLPVIVFFPNYLVWTLLLLNVFISLLNHKNKSISLWWCRYFVFVLCSCYMYITRIITTYLLSLWNHFAQSFQNIEPFLLSVEFNWICVFSVYLLNYDLNSFASCRCDFKRKRVEDDVPVKWMDSTWWYWELLYFLHYTLDQCMLGGGGIAVWTVCKLYIWVNTISI